jgi:hypothetical protein
MSGLTGRHSRGITTEACDGHGSSFDKEAQHFAACVRSAGVSVGPSLASA